MSRLRSAALLLLLCAAPVHGRGLDPGKALTQYSLDSWSTAVGLPQNSVTAIAQTRDGYLWLGSFGGLARFDGARFVVFNKSSQPALPNSGVQALLADKGGGLWVGTNGGGLTLLRDGVAKTYSVKDGLQGDVVRALLQDRRGRIWVGTDRGLSLIEDGRVRVWTGREGSTSRAVRALVEDADGAIWIGTNGDGLLRHLDGRFERWTRKEGLPSDFVFSLALDGQGALWVGTNGAGLARRADGRFRRYGTAEGLNGDIIWSLYKDSGGGLWVGTYGAGIYRLRGERFEGLRSVHGLPSDFVRAFAEDSEGSLWIGTNTGGLARLRDGKFTTYGESEGLPRETAKTVLADRDGTLWVGTLGGGLARFKDGAFTHFGRAEGLPHDFVQALLIDSKGTLWVGTNGAGVARLERGRFRAFGSREGLADDHVAAISEAKDGALWIGTNAGGVSRLMDGRITNYTREDGLGANLVLCTLVDRSGAVWVGTDGGGLTRIENGAFRTFTEADGLAADSVLSLHEDEETPGRLWIGTSGGGLSFYENGRLASASSRDGLLEDVVFAIVEDRRGALWLSGNRGISRIEKRALLLRAKGAEEPLHPLGFDAADGMKSDECSGVSQPAGTRLPDGRLVFPTTRGIVVIDPEHIPLNSVPPQVHIEELLAGGRSHRGPRVELPPGAGNWEVRFTALSLVAPHKVRFRYRLAGFDDEWQPSDGRRSAFYTQVPPGEYSFEVTASNNDGVWNKAGDRLQIRLAPRFHQTGLFVALVALSLMLLGAFGYAWRVRGLSARRRALEREVEERTHALREQQLAAEEARRESERQRELAQRANAVKGELLSIAAHDLKSPLQLVMGHAELAQLRLQQAQPVEEFVQQIHAAAQRMLGILNGLLDAAAVDAEQIELLHERVDLGAVTRRVVEAGMAAAARKSQRLALQASGPLFVTGDAGRLAEVVDNLVSNAIKYSPFRARIEVVVRQEGSRALVDVTDDGPGLSEEDKQRLFGRFQRLSAEPTAGEPSTGLGLSIAKRLAELQGGELRAFSEGPGKGSRFTLSMPLAGGGAPSGAAPIAAQ